MHPAACLQSRRLLESCGSSPCAGGAGSQLVKIMQQAPEHLRFYTLASCLLFIYYYYYYYFSGKKPKPNQNKRPRQHLTNRQHFARRANHRVQGSWRRLNEEFSASGFTQGHEDQQTSNRAEPRRAAGGGTVSGASVCPQPRIPNQSPAMTAVGSGAGPLISRDANRAGGLFRAARLMLQLTGFVYL